MGTRKINPETTDEVLLHEARQADISGEALQAGFETTIAGAFIAMVVLEVGNILIGSKLPIPPEWIKPAFIAIQFPELLVAGWFGLQAGFHEQDDRSM